jgi:hypothetical protein
MRKREIVLLWCVAVLASALAGCASSSPHPMLDGVALSTQAAVETPASLIYLQDTANQFALRPGFPAIFSASLSKAASSSNKGDSSTVVTGSEFCLEYGDNNRAGEHGPNGYIIAPGGNDDLAWAQYNIGAFHSKRPVKIRFTVTGVIAPWGNDDLPLLYWVGISDHTCGVWAMSGPYTSTTEIVVNSDQWCHRCVNSTDEMQVLVLTDASGIQPSPANPEGITAVEISSIAVTANARYKRTAPVLPYDLALTYDPSQFSVALSWTHLVDTSSSSNEAATYTLLRVQEGADTGEVLGTTAAPDATFVDGVDTGAGVPALVPGETYQYYVKADNGLTTDYVLIGSVTI